MNIIKEINQKFNRFLWNGKDVSSTRAKIAWNDVCFPKKKGWSGVKKSGNLECGFNDEAYLEFVCKVLFYMGCVG